MSIGRLVRALVALALTVVIGFAINYFALPAWTFQSTGFWWYWIILCVVFAVLCWIGDCLVGDDYDAPVFTLIGAGIAVVMAIILCISGFGGYQITNAYQYQKVAKVEEGSFEADVIEASPDEMITVDVRTAMKLGKRKLGDVKNSSWYEVNTEYNLVIINGEMYRISPLEYGSVFKYSKAKDAGIPG